MTSQTFYPNLQLDATEGNIINTILSNTQTLNFPPITGTDTLPSLALTQTFTGINSFTNSTAATSTSTGALIVTGGVGIGGNSYLGGVINATNSTASTSTSTGAIIVSGGVGIQGNSYLGGIINITNSTASTASSTGALVVTGGIGIQGSSFFGANLQVPDNNLYIAGKVIPTLATGYLYYTGSAFQWSTSIIVSGPLEYGQGGSGSLSWNSQICGPVIGTNSFHATNGQSTTTIGTSNWMMKMTNLSFANTDSWFIKMEVQLLDSANYNYTQWFIEKPKTVTTNTGVSITQGTRFRSGNNGNNFINYPNVTCYTDDNIYISNAAGNDTTPLSYNIWVTYNSLTQASISYPVLTAQNTPTSP